MEKRDYYTYHELLYALRGEYKRNQKIINELMKLIEIDSPSPYTSSLFLKQDYRNFHNENYPSLLLKIRKRQSAIKEALHDLGDSIGLENTYRYRKKNFEYIVKKDRYDYQFFAHNEVNGPQFYNPSVFIKNNKEFKELYSELQKGVLFNVPEVDLSLNHFQDLSINGHSISLDSNEKLRVNDPSIRISYEASDDQVHLKQDDYHEFYLINSLLNTKIPTYMLPHEYLDLLERMPYVGEYRNISIGSYKKEDVIDVFYKVKKLRLS